MQCPHCGQVHPDEARFCPSTGRTMDEVITCPRCGQIHPAGAKFCPVTGENLVSSPNPDEPEPKRTKMKERKSLNRTGQKAPYTSR